MMPVIQGIKLITHSATTTCFSPCSFYQSHHLLIFTRIFPECQAASASGIALFVPGSCCWKLRVLHHVERRRPSTECLRRKAEAASVLLIWRYTNCKRSAVQIMVLILIYLKMIRYVSLISEHAHYIENRYLLFAVHNNTSTKVCNITEGLCRVYSRRPPAQCSQIKGCLSD